METAQVFIQPVDRQGMVTMCLYPKRKRGLPIIKHPLSAKQCDMYTSVLMKSHLILPVTHFIYKEIKAQRWIKKIFDTSSSMVMATGCDRD